MESLRALEERHARELQELQNNVKQMLKGAKKSTRAQIEAQAIQMEFDIKARHREEMEAFEEGTQQFDLNAAVESVEIEVKTTVEPVDEEESAKSKKAKAKRKQVNDNQICYKVILF
jgi:VIT1/CCC1 family predicted Fe2+/Mn2+ transporter